MASKKIGKQTFALCNPPSIAGHANVVGPKEGDGPLKDSFDVISPDASFGERSWEKAEVEMQKRALSAALEKAKQTTSVLDFLFAGDLLNQCISAGYAARSAGVPFFGLYGACSTMAESLLLSSMAVGGGFADNAVAMTSSHFASSERQYRFPLGYGGQRTPTAQWTVTGSGSALVCGAGKGPRLTCATVGTVRDLGVKDAGNMGAAMAPAAYSTIKAHLEDMNLTPKDYDLIVTGDLGVLGHAIVTDLLGREGVDLSRNYRDCGLLLYDLEKQDMHAGGSGCGCSAAVLNGYLLDGLRRGATPLSTSVTLVVTGAKWSKYLKPRICSISSVNTRSKNRSQFWNPMVQMGMTVQPSLKYSSVTKFSVTLVMAEITRSEPPMTSS